MEELGKLELYGKEFDLSNDFDLQCLFDRMETNGVDERVAKSLATHISRMTKSLKVDVVKEYSTDEFPTLDYIEDEILDGGIGHSEDFIYDGKKYHAYVGNLGCDVIIKEIKVDNHG